MPIPRRVLQEFKERLDRYAEAYQHEVELFLGAPLEKQHDRSNVIAPGAELPKPRFSKPSEREADLPESWFSHEEALPVIEGRGKAGTARVQKADSLLRDALIVERIREVAVLASAADAKKLFTKALKLAAYIKSEIALQEARAYIKMLGHKARATDEKIEKARVYLKPGEKPPANIEVKEGPRGGRYYLTEDLDRVWRERGEEHRRAEERGDLVNVENLSEKAAEAVKSCLRAAKAIGWNIHVHSVTGFDAQRWASFWGLAGTRVGGKLITKALPYAAYDNGMIILGPSAVAHLEAVLGGATDWSSAFVIPAIAHETCHSVNPCGRGGYWGTNALIEEALTEWMQPDLAERLFTDVLGWSALDAKARAVVGMYVDEVENIEWAALTVVGGMHTRDNLHAKIKEWKETLDPTRRDGAIRVEVIAAYLRLAFPDIPDDLIEEVAYTNQAFINWSDMWQASSATAKRVARHNLLADALTMAQRQLRHKGLLDVEKTEPTPKGPEARKQAARDRVRRWRARLHERGDEEIRPAKRPEGWAWSIKHKVGLGVEDWAPEDMARLRETLPEAREVVRVNGLKYILAARETPRGMAWYIADHKGRRISETVYGGDAPEAYIAILRRESGRFGIGKMEKDFAGPPADAMTGADVGPIAPGCARCRRKVEKHDTEENPEHSHDPTQAGGGGKSAYLTVWTRKSEIENLLRSAKVGGRLVAHAQGFELETGRADKVKAALEPAGFKVEKFTRTRPGSTAPAHMRAYGHVVKVIGVLITDPSDKLEKHERRWHGGAFQKGLAAARYIINAESPHSGDKLHTDYTAKQGDTHSASAQDTSIVAPELGEGTDYQEYNAACKGGTCSLQAALSPDGEPYTPEVLAKAVPQGGRGAYGAVRTLYKAEDDEEKEYVVGGYASPQVIDKEHHLITKEAMREDLPRFLAEPKYRNAMLLHCLRAGTLVKVSKGRDWHGFVPIEEINKGDEVYTHRGRLQRVLKTFCHPGPDTIMRLELENGEVVHITDQHRVLTTIGWVKAGDLTTDHVLHHLVKRGHRSWRLADSAYRQLFGRGLPNKSLSRDAAENTRKRMQQVGSSGAGARVTAAQRKGRTWEAVYGHPRPSYGGNAGERHPNWKGGRPRRGYTWDFPAIRLTIIERDGACLACGAAQSRTRGLAVHHIDENRANNHPDNLATLCDSCHSRVTRGTLALANGIKILSVTREPYDGLVYNLEVEEDNSYAGNGIIYHNSNVQVGEVLPQWTHPKTGQVFKTEVDDIGLFCVIKIRTDPNRPPIVDQVIKDIEEGKLASFSISGDAPLESRHYTCQDGKCFWLISKIIFYEITVCELGVNQDAKLVVLSKSADARRTSCLICGGKVDKAETTLIDIAESKIHQSYTEAMDRLRALGHLTRKERIDLSDAITDALDAFRKKVESLGLDDRKVPADDAALLAKEWVGDAPERVKLVARIMEGLGALGDADLRLLADDHWPIPSDGDTDSAEELKEKVEAVAEAIGEEQAIRMLEDVQQADSLQVKAGGIGDSTPTSGAVTQDVGRTVSKATDETAPWEIDEVQQQVAVYERYVKRGAQTNEAYDKMLEGAPDWFGTRADEFGLFLVALHQAGLPIPQVRLRIAGEEQGERVPDPQWTAESLLDAWLEALSDYKSRLEEAPRGEVRLLAKHDTEENPEHSHDPTGGKTSYAGVPMNQRPFDHLIQLFGGWGGDKDLASRYKNAYAEAKNAGNTARAWEIKKLLLEDIERHRIAASRPGEEEIEKHDTEENPTHSHDPTKGGGDVPAHDIFTVDRNPDMPAVWRDYSAADSPGKVGAVTRKWQKLDDAGQARISAGALFFLKDQRLEQLPRSTATRSVAEARADRIFTIRDSTGRGRARKRN